MHTALLETCLSYLTELDRADAAPDCDGLEASTEQATRNLQELASANSGWALADELQAAQQRGDRKSVDLLLKTIMLVNERLVLTTVEVHVHNDIDVSDIVQDVWVKVFIVFCRRLDDDPDGPDGSPPPRPRPRPGPPGTFQSWLRAVARNAAISHLRAQRVPGRRSTSLIDDSQINTILIVEDTDLLGREQVLNIFRQAFEELSPAEQRTARLAFCNVPYSDISVILAIPLGTLKARMSDIRRKLTASLFKRGALLFALEDPVRSESHLPHRVASQGVLEEAFAEAFPATMPSREQLDLTYENVIRRIHKECDSG